MVFASVHSIIQAFSNVFPEKTSIAIADQSRFVYYQPSPAIDLRIKPGDAVQEGTLTQLALEKQMSLSRFLDKNPFGMPYYAVSTPIVNGGKTEGCLTAIYPPFATPKPLQLPRHNFLIGKTEERWIPIPFRDIYMIESANKKTLLHTASGIYGNKHSLIELELMLPLDQFARTHRAYLVNVNEIAEIQPNFHSTFLLIMKHDKRLRIPVSQKYANRFRQLMGF